MKRPAVSSRERRSTNTGLARSACRGERPFCVGEFRVAELRAVYEAVWGIAIDPRNFHRKVTGAAGFLDPTGETTTRNGGRPAALYRRGRAELLSPPLLRS